MAIGWALCAFALLALSATGLPPAYWCTDADGSYVTTCDAQHRNHPACAAADGTSAAAAAAVVVASPCNADAAGHGGNVALLFSLACVGYVCADVAADGLTVTYAQREPIEIRGRTQSTVYFVRSLGFIASYVLVGFGMNGREVRELSARTLHPCASCVGRAHAAARR